jgi:hypothetical protein
MTVESDEFSIQLLDEAKAFLEKAIELDHDGDIVRRSAFLHACLVMAFSALESHLNGVASELADRDGWELPDKSLLLEKSIKLDKGVWVLGDSQYFRLEDRLEFLFVSHGSDDFRETAWWSTLHTGIKLRNDLVHPRDSVDFSVTEMSRYLSAIIEGLNSLYSVVFKKGHPSYGRALQPTFSL